jgi:GAF domain-containing protein
MIVAPLPITEHERLQALYGLMLLDSGPEERFDRLTHFARQEFDVPIARLSLVGRDRQWFKSHPGLGICETARDISMCSHVVNAEVPLIVPDTRQDIRFHDNPLVLGPPHIRFYAGLPLTLPAGQTVGTLCLINTQPRRIDARDLAILASLRDMAVAELLVQELAAC